MSKKLYTIVGLDGTESEMTIAEVAAATGLKYGTIQRRLLKGMRRMESLKVSPEAALKAARRKFSMQSTAHFAENKKKREAVASRPVYREWKRES